MNMNTTSNQVVPDPEKEKLKWKKIVVNIVQRSRVSGVCLEQRDDRKRHRAVSARLSGT